MKVKDLMIPDPITISPSSSISDAIEIMKNNSIRHLPVVAKGNKLKGFVTLSSLRQGLMPSMLEDLSFSDLIIKNPVTVNPEDDIDIAAQLIYKYKIGGMPVVNKNKLVGIITESDILRAFIDMMGLLEKSSRVDVFIDNKPGRLRKAFDIIHDNKGEILNVALEKGPSSRKVHYFRLMPCKTQKIRKALEKEGFEVMGTRD
ncbi:MAG: CBS domain-containing protein [Deltaproteobacteria bacterium]|nr:CBS domain-containing protein [Deltaproteobacteria bacterium]